jgi:leucyl aminopeptidase
MLDLLRGTKPASGKPTLALINSDAELKQLGLSAGDKAHILDQLNADALVAGSESNGALTLVHRTKKEDRNALLERARKAGAEMCSRVNTLRIPEAQLLGLSNDADATLAMAEGVCLANYEFRKYKTTGKGHSLKKLAVLGAGIDPAAVDELDDVCESVCMARDWVNEPVVFLTATQMASQIRDMGRQLGIRVTVFNKQQIEAFGMGGLLGVNKGSQDPPTFTVLEHKPKNAVNDRPIVLVGKGVVFDTGGLSLKPTPNSMDYMKCDMGGAAAVCGGMAAIARQHLPVHVIGLIPATDNRPGERAIVPGDVLRMHNGLTVEVMNTDAEGRLILADALSYGEQFKPELVMTIATLTGAAQRAIGNYGIAVMGTAADERFAELKTVGDLVHERTAQLPFWPEYDAEIESTIADIKNLGSDLAGAQTAGKFLARFTKHPFIHLDIAGPAFLHKRDSYRGQGGTGCGVRLFYHFVKARGAKGKRKR